MSASLYALQHPIWAWQQNCRRTATAWCLCYCRSKFDVARHLGIQVQRRPGGRDIPDLDMADADVAAVLMSMPHDNG